MRHRASGIAVHETHAKRCASATTRQLRWSALLPCTLVIASGAGGDARPAMRPELLQFSRLDKAHATSNGPNTIVAVIDGSSTPGARRLRDTLQFRRREWGLTDSVSCGGSARLRAGHERSECLRAFHTPAVCDAC